MMATLPGTVDAGKLKLIEQRPGSPADYPHRDRMMRFMGTLSWLKRPVAVWSGMQIDGVLSVFLVETEVRSPKADRHVWIVVGDVPPAYLVTDDAPNAICALDGYVLCMRDWVEAVRAGRSVDDLIPVNAPPTTEYADMLAKRLAFIEKEIIEPDKDQLVPVNPLPVPLSTSTQSKPAKGEC